MFSYHIECFYLYLAIFSIAYGIFLFFWLLYHPRSKKKTFFLSFLSLIAIVSIVSLPCGMLYQLQDMLAGFYPTDIRGVLWGGWRHYLAVGWLMVLSSMPLNILAVAGFFATNHYCVARYEQGYRPWFYRRLAKWNAEHPNRLFFIVGTLLFIIVIACGLSSIEYQRNEPRWLDAVYILKVRPYGWLIIGMIFPFVESLACGLAFCCWIFKLIHFKLAWIVLFVASFSMFLFSFWNILPQNAFIRTMRTSYKKSMRLQELSVSDSFNGGIMARGKFSYQGDLLAELKAETGMDFSQSDSPFALKITSLGNRLYSFETLYP